MKFSEMSVPDESAYISKRETGEMHFNVDTNGRIDPDYLTDREIRVETLQLMRALFDTGHGLMIQIGPAMESIGESPIGRMLGIVPPVSPNGK